MFSAIPASLLARRIDFRELSLIELRAAVAGSIAGIVAAIAGLGDAG